VSTGAPTTLESIRRHLVGLKMPRSLEILDQLMRQLERGELAALEAIDALLAEEHALREGRRIQAALKMGRLTTIKTLDGFDFSFQPSLDRERIFALAELDFIDRHEVLHLLGQPGCGKSQVSRAMPGPMPRGRARSFRLRPRDRGSGPVFGVPGTGPWCRREPSRSELRRA